MDKGDFVIFCLFLVFLISAFLLFQRQKAQALKTIEIQFLFGTMFYIDFKDNMLKVLEVIYEKAGESDPQFIKDYELIKKKVEERDKALGDQWIKNLQDVLNYKTEYENWEDVTKYIKKLSENIEKNGYRKGN